MRRAVFALLLGACARSHAPEPPASAAASLEGSTRVVDVVEVALPRGGSGPLAPSLVRAAPGMGHVLADVDGCATCHADVADQWRKSAHAFASFNNPVYRVAVDKLRHDRGNVTSQFCGGCHDPSLLVDGAMLGEVEPTDLRAHAGITCATCHSIAEARADGNASYEVDPSPIPIPVDAPKGVDGVRGVDPESALRHRARVGQATLRTAAMCGTCHKAFLDASTGNAAHLVGQDDATPWARSAFAGSDAARIDAEVPLADCRGCHMPRVAATNGDAGAKNGTVASHAFLGGHTWLASMENDPALVGRAQAFLQERLRLYVGAARSGPSAGRAPILDRPVQSGGAGARSAAAPSAGESVILDMVVQNVDVGHRFPGGVLDAADAWLEVVVLDARGRRVAEAGTEHEASGGDASTHVLASYMARADGSRLTLRETHEFRAGVWNDTIAPRDAAVVRFAFVVPASAEVPLRVEARLRHRTRNLELQAAACADTRSERGVRFGKIGLAKVARAIDACRPQPVTELAHTEMTLGAPRAASFEREIAYGLGLSHAVQEHLDDARAPYQAALTLAQTPRERAIALGGLAQIASRQGRTDETFALATEADLAAHDAGMPPPPSMQRARAEVLASTWRLAEAAPVFLDVASHAPRDDAAWAAAAVAFGGAGDPRAALDAARHGLVDQPRDGDLLRVQALALDALGSPSEGAHAAFLERRTPDDAPSIRAKCSANVPACANERIPVHVHAMRQLLRP